MAWLGKVSLGNFPDLAGAVNKFSESVKNIEKNFDNALGLEEKGDSSEASGLWPSATDRKALFEPMMAFMGHKSEENSVESSEEVESLEYPSPIEQNKEVFTDEVPSSITEQTSSPEQENEESESKGETKNTDPDETEAESQLLESKKSDPTVINVETHNSFSHLQQEESTKLASSEISEPEESKSQDQVEIISPVSDESHSDINILEQKLEAEDIIEKSSPVQLEELDAREAGDEIDSNPTSTSILKEESTSELVSNNSSDPSSPEMVAEVVGHESGSLLNTSERNKVNDFDVDTKDQRLSSGTNVSDTIDSDINLEKVKMEMKMMEAALQGAARQAQAKADEIEKLMIENEQLKTIIEDLKRKSNEAESESLRDEYHQRVASLERKVYALTKERDTLRREQNKKSDAASLLKEKDEIINQVMAEGESLSKKQAAQESQIRKLRAQIREFEEEKKGLVTKLQVLQGKNMFLYRYSFDE
ncbi:hypothetical protein GIB67_013561 [Kingdonia uniflora]|uniref:Golgin candidate 5 n=1 Tax=Kingdonia uniflora TaxID=39325 RepID=A0A7J7KV23_9MAGN|nr:hypothetical protein GIB67_013561 [Kingdonia uniflora]